jgi:hypothetical protein
MTTLNSEKPGLQAQELEGGPPGPALMQRFLSRVSQARVAFVAKRIIICDVDATPTLTLPEGEGMILG